jgi:hypothetical protein
MHENKSTAAKEWKEDCVESWNGSTDLMDDSKEIEDKYGFWGTIPN